MHARSVEYWFYMFLIVIVGNLENAKVAVAAISIWSVNVNTRDRFMNWMHGTVELCLSLHDCAV